ncbi:MAG: DUF1292 domain-containing protein [Lachnospiraceae bacterium]|nr:DUF1292 domain-containing protein [Lachnospiraceae bacterium]
MSDKPDIFADEDLDSIIILNDENGKECRFEFLDLIDYKGREFIVLLSEEEAAKEESDVDILEVVPDENNPELENYLPIEDDATIEAVFQLFEENNKDNMDFC